MQLKLRASLNSRIFFLAACLAASGCAVKKLPTDMGNPKWGLDVTWHGHSCFTLKDSVDRTIVIERCLVLSLNLTACDTCERGYFPANGTCPPVTQPIANCQFYGASGRCQQCDNFFALNDSLGTCGNASLADEPPEAFCQTFARVGFRKEAIVDFKPLTNCTSGSQFYQRRARVRSALRSGRGHRGQ